MNNLRKHFKSILGTLIITALIMSVQTARANPPAPTFRQEIDPTFSAAPGAVLVDSSRKLKSMRNTWQFLPAARL